MLKKDRVLMAKFLVTTLISFIFYPILYVPFYVIALLVPPVYYGFWLIKRITDEGMKLFSLEDPPKNEEHQE